MILAIDPGNIHSAYCWIGDGMRPMGFGKVPNDEMIRLLYAHGNEAEDIIIEKIASYGMSVGQEVFDTCIWIGRFAEAAGWIAPAKYIYRKDVKINLCGSMKAKDGNIRQALIDRFGVVGTKKAPGWFYGFAADVWAAYAVGVTYLDKNNGGCK